ncbi:Gametolysin peptidase M11 [Legionella busanensis]|uniref:Gametolysin peptidase M11 n=1 Tax=Legionella busanensis TaxID=190655 RepID=A0A378JLU7_9GAMM|nr:hypothetical protein [Legionella busanensis]STX51273.1 Gametolysin peptidase M11 [Legionella busanensis]
MRQVKYFLFGIFLSCSSFAFAQTYQGELEVLIFDDFSHNQSKTIYQLHEGDEVYILNLPNTIDKANLLSGKTVIIEGQEVQGVKEKTIKVDSLTIPNKTSFSELPNENPAIYETRKVLALLVNFTNMQATTTVSTNTVDSILYTSTRSTRANFQRSSFNQVNFIRDTNSDGKPDIYVINLNYAASGCNYNQWAIDARNAATRAGINLSLYRHHMFVIPQNVSCNWGGLGHLGCGTTCSTWVRAYSPSQVYSQLIYTHELGHNLGMNHAATDTNNDGVSDSEYGDAACIMGTGDFQYYKEVNAPHRDKMQWFASFPNRIANVTAGSYTLYPLEAGVTGTGLLALKVKKNATDTYYISYRKNIGPFGSGAAPYLDKISIHRTRTGDAHTYFIRTLSAGQTFADLSNNVKVTAVVIGGNVAIVNIN